MSVEWNEQDLPLSRIFGLEVGFVDNAITTQFDSGRTIAIQKNTKTKRTYNINYCATKSQLESFYVWYETLNGGNAGTFTAKSLRDNNTIQEYRLGGTPTITGHNLKTISMTWIEV